jgi:hypothetical protein
MIEAVRTHCRASTTGDFDPWMKIWADDVEVEDPVGAPPHRGIEAVRTTFWACRATPPATDADRRCNRLRQRGDRDHDRSKSAQPTAAGHWQPVVDHFIFDGEREDHGHAAFLQVLGGHPHEFAH